MLVELHSLSVHKKIYVSSNYGQKLTTEYEYE